MPHALPALFPPCLVVLSRPPPLPPLCAAPFRRSRVHLPLWVPSATFAPSLFLSLCRTSGLPFLVAPPVVLRLPSLPACACRTPMPLLLLCRPSLAPPALPLRISLSLGLAFSRSPSITPLFFAVPSSFRLGFAWATSPPSPLRRSAPRRRLARLVAAWHSPCVRLVVGSVFAFSFRGWPLLRALGCTPAFGHGFRVLRSRAHPDASPCVTALFLFFWALAPVSLLHGPPACPLVPSSVSMFFSSTLVGRLVSASRVVPFSPFLFPLPTVPPLLTRFCRPPARCFRLPLVLGAPFVPALPPPSPHPHPHNCQLSAGFSVVCLLRCGRFTSLCRRPFLFFLFRHPPILLRHLRIAFSLLVLQPLPLSF